VKSARFSFLFPLLELVISVVLIAVPATLSYFGMRQSTNLKGKAVVSTNLGRITIPQHEMWPIALEGAAMNASHAIATLNIPGTIVEALISIPTSWPHLRQPANLPMDIWRSITLPFFSLPFWWLVGRGFDSVRARQTRWPLTLIGTVLFICFIVLFCGLRFGLSRADRMDESWPLWGLGLWALLFGVFPLAWLLRQRPVQLT
jgi:hypothetical protein